MKSHFKILENILLALPISFLFNLLLCRLRFTYWEVLDCHPARCLMDIFYPHVPIDGETSYDVRLFDDILVSNGIFMTIVICFLMIYEYKKIKRSSSN